MEMTEVQVDAYSHRILGGEVADIHGRPDFLVRMMNERDHLGASRLEHSVGRWYDGWERGCMFREKLDMINWIAWFVYVRLYMEANENLDSSDCSR